MCLILGGNWNNGGNAGPGAVNWNNSRANSNTNVGVALDSAPPHGPNGRSGAEGCAFLALPKSLCLPLSGSDRERQRVES